MDLTYFGHATFLLGTNDTTILIDPFNADCGYPIPDLRPTAVAVSHEHFDHSYVEMARGKPQVIRGLAEGGKAWARVDEQVGSVRVTAVPTFHDDRGGLDRGRNVMFVFEVEDLRVVHAGDLGHPLDAQQQQAVGRPDVLMIPVGGHYTIGPAEADQVIAGLRPHLVIPMHYKTDATAGWPIGPVDAFLRGKPVARQGQRVSITRASLPPPGTVWVLAYQA